jgi:tetratricopeptide (TPR) repeat protein
LDHIATELQVQYLLDGSIRRSGQRLRVVARLTETQIGKTEWSEKFDFSEGDIFELQDELSQRIVSAVAPASLGAEMERAQRRSPENPETWIEVMRAHSHLRRLTQPDNIEAQSILVAAFDRRPGIAMLASDLAISHVYDALFGWSVSRRKSNELADQFARQAILIDRNDALAYTALGFAAHTNCAHEDSVNAFNTALRLNENLAEAHGYLAMTLGFVGEVRQVEYHVDRAIQLSPYDPMLAFWFDAAAMAAYMARQFELALDWANRSVAENPDYIGGLRVLAAACGQLGRTKKANSTVAKILTLDPTLTCDATTRQLPFRSPGEADLYAQGLRVAGLP